VYQFAEGTPLALDAGRGAIVPPSRGAGPKGFGTAAGKRRPVIREDLVGTRRIRNALRARWVIEVDVGVEN